MLSDAFSPDRFPSPLDLPLEMPPTRIVSLVPALTETLIDLDLGHRLVGISAFCTRPPERVAFLPRVGEPSRPDLAQIVALEPDLVLVDERSTRLEDAAALQDAGLRLWVTGPRTVLEALNLLWHLMEVCDHAVMVPRVREIERAFDYAQGAAAASRPVRVFAALGYDVRDAARPWITMDATSYAHDVLRVCGGANLIADLPSDLPPAPADSGLVRLSLDHVIGAQPEIVLLPETPDEPGPVSAAEWFTLDLPAAHTGRIHRIDPTLLTWYGTRIGFALRDLPPLLMGEA